MNKFKTITLSGLLLLGILLIMSSCKKDDEDDATPNQTSDSHEDAYGDVFIKKVKSAQGEKYGLVFYAGGQDLTTCQVTSPSGTTYTLDTYWKGTGNLRLHPENNEMQNTMPEAGDYVFLLNFSDGTSKTITDALTSIEINAITTTSVTHTTGSNEITTTWGAINNVDNYMVKLTDKYKNENQPYFVHKALTSEDTSYTFNTSTKASPGWMQSEPSAGDTCYVMIVGIKYEDSVDATTKEQNKQLNTVKTSMIIW